MTIEKWKKIWANKGKKIGRLSSLGQLLEMNGHDTGFGSFTPDEWETMVKSFYGQVTFEKGSNVLEIGCGCGAFLYVLQELCPAHYYGIDYSENLIRKAEELLSDCQFMVSEANQLAFSDIKFDVIYVYSVFQYFPDVSYAEEVIKIWSEQIKPGGLLVLMDLNDDRFQKDYHAVRANSYDSIETYFENYKSLSHLFMNELSLEQFLLNGGFSSVKSFDLPITNPEKVNLRFNLLAVKRGENNLDG